MIDLNGHKGKNGEEEKLLIYILYLSISEFFNVSFCYFNNEKEKNIKMINECSTFGVGHLNIAQKDKENKNYHDPTALR